VTPPLRRRAGRCPLRGLDLPWGGPAAVPLTPRLRRSAAAQIAEQ